MSGGYDNYVPCFTSSSVLIVTNQVRPLPKTLDDELVAFGPAIDVLDIVGGSLEVAGCVVALGDEDVVVDAALQGFVEGDRGSLRKLVSDRKRYMIDVP